MKRCKRCNGLGYKLEGYYLPGVGHSSGKIQCKKCYGKGVIGK